MQAIKMALATSLLALSVVAAHADGMTLSAAPSARSSNCYLKVYGSGSFVSKTLDVGSVSADLGSNGLGIGGGLGCDVTQGAFLAGVFGDYTWNNASVDIKAGGVTALSMPFGNEWSIGARAGVFPTPSTLLYGLVAYTAAQDKSVSMMGSAFSFNGPKGVSVGAGVETALTKNLTFDLEFRHTAFDTSTTSALPVTFDTTENSVHAGFAYHFGSVQ